MGVAPRSCSKYELFLNVRSKFLENTCEIFYHSVQLQAVDLKLKKNKMPHMYFSRILTRDLPGFFFEKDWFSTVLMTV